MTCELLRQDTDHSVTTHTPTTGKSIDFERYITAPEIGWVLTVGVDPRGYFLGGFNLFRLANKKLFGFFVCII